MILRGKVSSIENSKYRIAIPDRENVVSQPLGKDASINTLEVGDEVVAVFFSNQLDGVILSKIGVTMIIKGTISSVEGGYQITIPDQDNLVSQPMQKASHVPDLLVGDEVVAIFFSNQLTGVIMAKI